MVREDGDNPGRVRQGRTTSHRQGTDTLPSPRFDETEALNFDATVRLEPKAKTQNA